MKVIEFIKDQSKQIQQSNEHLINKWEPKLKSFGEFVNDRVAAPLRNNLNTPWISLFNLSHSCETSEEKELVQSPEAERAYLSLSKSIGEETYLGDWFTIDQECINQFASVTGDTQWIHTDPDRAAIESPFKTTVAHGFLTLALIPKLTNAVGLENNLYPEAKMVINFGLNKVRFPYPVKSGSRVRARMRLINLIPMKRSIEVINEISIEIENTNRPACIAETVLRLYF